MGGTWGPQTEPAGVTFLPVSRLYRSTRMSSDSARPSESYPAPALKLASEAAHTSGEVTARLRPCSMLPMPDGAMRVASAAPLAKTRILTKGGARRAGRRGGGLPMRTSHLVLLLLPSTPLMPIFRPDAHGLPGVLMSSSVLLVSGSVGEWGRWCGET